MKIKINEQESYQIVIEDKDYSPQEFLHLLSRLINISKIVMLKELKDDTEDTGKDNTGEIAVISENKPEKSGKIKHGIVLSDKTLSNCLFCSSENLMRAGRKVENGVSYQVYLCRNCGRRLGTHPSFEKKDKLKRRKVAFKWKDRDEVIRLLKAHYLGTEEDKKNFLYSKIGEKVDDWKKNWLSVSKGASNLRRRFNIQPEEVGIKEFPTMMAKNIERI